MALAQSSNTTTLSRHQRDLHLLNSFKKNAQLSPHHIETVNRLKQYGRREARIPSHLLEEHNRLLQQQQQEQEQQQQQVDDTLADVEIHSVSQLYEWLESNDPTLTPPVSEKEALINDYRHRLRVFGQTCQEIIDHIDGMFIQMDEFLERYTRAQKNLEDVKDIYAKECTEQATLVDFSQRLSNKLAHFDRMEIAERFLCGGQFSCQDSRTAGALRIIDQFFIEFLQHPNHQAFKDKSTCMNRCARVFDQTASRMRDQFVTSMEQTVVMGKRYVNPYHQRSLQHGQVFNGMLTTATMTSLENHLHQSSHEDQLNQSTDRLVSKISLMKSICQELEIYQHHRVFKEALNVCCERYMFFRNMLVLPVVTDQLKRMILNYAGDIPLLVSCGCMILIQICCREYELFHSLFRRPSDMLRNWFGELFRQLRTRIRPLYIRATTVNTLFDLQKRMRSDVVDFLSEHVEKLQRFNVIYGGGDHGSRCNGDDEKSGDPSNQHLHGDAVGATTKRGIEEWLRSELKHIQGDIQETMIHRAHVYIRDETIGGFTPSSEDLNYPQKLQQPLHNDILDPKTSPQMEEGTTLPNDDDDGDHHRHQSLLPFDRRWADWYVPMKNALCFLSRMYEMVDEPVFVQVGKATCCECIKSLFSASGALCKKASFDDGQLFLIRHLLIFREQLTPFRDCDFFQMINYREDIHSVNVLSQVFDWAGNALPFGNKGLSSPLPSSNMHDTLEHLIEGFLSRHTKSYLNPISVFAKMTIANMDHTSVSNVNSTHVPDQPNTLLNEEKLRSTVVYMCTAFQKDIIPAIKLIHVYAPNEYYRNYLMEKLKKEIRSQLDAFVILIQNCFPGCQEHSNAFDELKRFQNGLHSDHHWKVDEIPLDV